MATGVLLPTLCRVYASNGVSELDEKEVFYDKFDAVIGQSSPRNTPVVLGDINTLPGLTAADKSSVLIPMALILYQECQCFSI